MQKVEFEKAGVKITGIGAHNFRAADLTDVVLRARRANPDVWVQTGYVPDGNLMLRTAREQGYKPKMILFVGTGDTFETLDALDTEYLEGLFVVSYPRPDVAEKFGPGAAAYLDSYRKAYNREPVAPQGMAAFTGMHMLLDAVAAAGTTEMTKVRAAAKQLSDRLWREVR